MVEGKLTKKQRKTAEFRTKVDKESKTKGKDEKDEKVNIDDRKDKNEDEGMNDLKGKQKQYDDGDAADDLVDRSEQVKPVKMKKKVQRADITNTEEGSQNPTTEIKPKPSKKRKHEEESKVDSKSDGKATKKRFDQDGNVIESIEQNSKEEKEVKANSNVNDSKRFIVFVGNMSFKTTTQEITKHFADHCGERPSVRLLTTRGDSTKVKELSKSKQKSIAKGKALDPGAPQSKGCAFVEFKQREAMQKALQFHHTKLQGRSINVELTAGGGGKGAERKEKIAKKNKVLEEERRKLHEKYVKDTNKKTTEKSVVEGQSETKKQEEEPRKPQWGPNASSNGKPRQATKIPRWAATGANATRLQT